MRYFGRWNPSTCELNGGNEGKRRKLRQLGKEN